LAGQCHQVQSERQAAVADHGGKSIAVFDKTGKPLTPSDGITFDGRLGLMQGIIATPSGDVWALGVSKRRHRSAGSDLGLERQR
jgi:hypothetical protein